MFKVGDFVSYGNVGVCKVEGISSIDMDGSHKPKDYYIIRPVFDQKRTIYCPIDSTKVPIRKNISEEETYQLLDKIPVLEIYQFESKRAYDGICKEVVQSGDCEKWLRLIMTLVYERKVRIQQGRKITSTNTKYLHDAENKLYGEMAIALKKEKTQIEEMMKQRLN